MSQVNPESQFGPVNPGNVILTANTDGKFSIRGKSGAEVLQPFTTFWEHLFNSMSSVYFPEQYDPGRTRNYSSYKADEDEATTAQLLVAIRNAHIGNVGACALFMLPETLGFKPFPDTVVQPIVRIGALITLLTDGKQPKHYFRAFGFGIALDPEANIAKLHKQHKSFSQKSVDLSEVVQRTEAVNLALRRMGRDTQ